MNQKWIQGFMACVTVPGPAINGSGSSFRAHRKIWFAVLGLALVLRLLAMLPVNFHHPDEVWQYLEPAHRLAFGRWVVAWEYRDGIRTWLIPALLAGPMQLGNFISPSGSLYLILPRLLLVFMSLSVVACATAMGLRISQLHGAMAGFISAVWAEMVYFGSHAMSEPISMVVFFPAALLLTRRPEDRSITIDLLAGFLLGICFSLRFQLAPALGVLALFGCGLRPRAWGWLVAGAMLGLGLNAAVDAVFGQHPPLRWIYRNFQINLVEHKSSSFGVEPFYWYVSRIANVWRLALLIIVPFSIIGARRYPVLMAVALVNLLAHSLIPHKEYRFVLLSTTCLVILAGIGCADYLRDRAAGDPSRLRKIVIQAMVLWSMVSFLAAFSGPLKRSWKSGSSLISALQLAGADAKTCGLALYQPPYPLTAAYVFYHRDTPIYLFNGVEDRSAALRYQNSFDTVLSVKGAGALSPEYALVGCTSKDYCVYRRPGTCAGSAPARYDVNVALGQLGI